jgi:5'-nucleotidase
VIIELRWQSCQGASAAPRCEHLPHGLRRSIVTAPPEIRLQARRIRDHRDPSVLILLTNDDGIYAPGLAAMERELEQLGDVYVVSPATEQSGVGHSITYLNPLVVKELFEGRQRRGWAVEGSPADCVKIGIFEFCPRLPDLVVSGINGGLNAGINVLYSGTVAAAIEGAFFGLTSVAVSLEFDEHAQFDRAARLARKAIEQILKQKGTAPQLYNLNIPTAALTLDTPRVRVVPMGLNRTLEQYEKRTDPRGRSYFWALSEPKVAREDEDSDVSALAQGFVTLTPLDFDLTKRLLLAEMKEWSFDLTVGG